MIKNYDDFEFDVFIESLLMESKIEFSDRLGSIIHQMKKNRISGEILKIKKNQIDLDFPQNYIDIGGIKDEVTSVSNSKSKEFFAKNEDMYDVVYNNRYLTHSARNKYLFDRLGYNKYFVISPEDGRVIYTADKEWDPIIGTKGVIRSETSSDTSNRTYVLFVGKGNNDSRDGKEVVINKTALVPVDTKTLKIWTKYRNNIKIGRLVRSILNTASIAYTDKEIEDFVNLYKSIYDITTNAFSKFKIVKTGEIAKWYNCATYDSISSTLGSSCMGDKPIEFFDIYCENTNCSMLILFSDNGTIAADGSYSSKTIVGRALLWKTKAGDIFVDRIYTNNDSDVDLFKKYAHENGWWTKQKQDSSNFFSVTNGIESKVAEYIVELENVKFESYPFFDSLYYLNMDEKLISNVASLINPDFEMSSTVGYLEEI